MYAFWKMRREIWKSICEFIPGTNSPPLSLSLLAEQWNSRFIPGKEFKQFALCVVSINWVTAIRVSNNPLCCSPADRFHSYFSWKTHLGQTSLVTERSMPTLWCAHLVLLEIQGFCWTITWKIIPWYMPLISYLH